MSIEYEGSFEGLYIGCDIEGCSMDGDYYGSFQECIEEAKEEGWVNKQMNREWENICPDCAADPMRGMEDKI